MVKYGKLYRELQIKEFSSHYIDYKKIKIKTSKKMKMIIIRIIIIKQINQKKEKVIGLVFIA